eukprot:m.48005 g.48005  ORF g.48005 m.48005 type:complete len:239 (-) comp20639_c0_seq2:940-1656(-)
MSTSTRNTHEKDELSDSESKILDESCGITADTDRPFCKPMQSPQNRWSTRTGLAEKNKFYGVESASGNSIPEKPYPDKYTKFVDFRIISRYNFKGGVGKTTGTFSLAWELAKQKKKVLMVDADVQRSLTKLVLGRDVRLLTERENYEQFFASDAHENKLDGNFDLFAALAPVLCAGVNNFDSLTPAQNLSRLVGQMETSACFRHTSFWTYWSKNLRKPFRPTKSQCKTSLELFSLSCK